LRRVELDEVVAQLDRSRRRRRGIAIAVGVRHGVLL
jgi:hypothetical protein